MAQLSHINWHLVTRLACLLLLLHLTHSVLDPHTQTRAHSTHTTPRRSWLEELQERDSHTSRSHQESRQEGAAWAGSSHVPAKASRSRLRSQAGSRTGSHSHHNTVPTNRDLRQPQTRPESQQPQTQHQWRLPQTVGEGNTRHEPAGSTTDQPPPEQQQQQQQQHMQNTIPEHQADAEWQRRRWQKKVYRPAAPKPPRRPNIVLIMTDDQDVELGSLNYMPWLMGLVRERGAHFPNAYCSTPICCPSRSSMLTGLYIHNHEVYTNNHNCSSYHWQQTHERRTFATYLQQAGYRTGYFGKYLNKYNGSHIPAGWHEWVGLLKNSRYYNYTVLRNGHFVKYGDQYPQDYFPHVITSEGVRFLQQSGEAPDAPMLLVLSYPAPHGPEDSAPEHSHRFFNATDHNTMSYNYAPNPDKQWLLQFTGRMHDIEVKFTDLLMTKRLQTLQTVDESVAKVVRTLESLNQLDNTYIFYTSDHGYHLGQFGLVKGKSMPFEFDIKVPFLVRGPGIAPGTQINNIALNIDLAPTFLDIGGVPAPSHMDGRSLLPLLLQQPERTPTWRHSFLVESSGRHREEDALQLREERRRGGARGLGDGQITRGGLYTSKRERLELICQNLEYQAPCSPGQQWHCVREHHRWRLQKCRSSGGSGRSQRWRKRHCVCEPQLGMGYLVKLDSTERRKQRLFLKKHLTKDLRSHGAKFLKTFNDVDSQELLEQSLASPLLPGLPSKTSRVRRGVAGQQQYPDYPDVAVEDDVDAFVHQEEIREIDVTIDSLSDELHNLESVAGSAASANRTQLATAPTHESPGVVGTGEPGCQVKGSGLVPAPGCWQDVYQDPQAWRLSKVAIDSQIRRLRHQLAVMKNIRQHLREARPQALTPNQFYPSYEQDEDSLLESSGDLPLHSLFVRDNTTVPLLPTLGEEVEEAGSGLHGGTEGQGRVEVDEDDDGVIIYGIDYDAARSDGEPHHTPRQEVGGSSKLPMLPPDPHQGQVLPDTHIPGHGRCWCNPNYRIKRKQEERNRKREERLRLRLERQQVKEERRHLKQKRKQRRIKKNLSQCNHTMLNCHTHDNHHWKTPPLWHDGKFCFCMNAVNNTYWCVRTINQTHNFLYCEFITGLVTYYDLNIDPYQLRNVAFTLSNQRLADLHHRLEDLRTCSGVVQCDNLPHGLPSTQVFGALDPPWRRPEPLLPVSNSITGPSSVRGSREERRRLLREERHRQRQQRQRARQVHKRRRRKNSGLVNQEGEESRRLLGWGDSGGRVVRLPRKSRTHRHRHRHRRPKHAHRRHSSTRRRP